MCLNMTYETLIRCLILLEMSQTLQITGVIDGVGVKAEEAGPITVIGTGARARKGEAGQ